MDGMNRPQRRHGERRRRDNKCDRKKRLAKFELPDWYSATRIFVEHGADVRTFWRWRQFLKGQFIKLAVLAGLATATIRPPNVY